MFSNYRSSGERGALYSAEVGGVGGADGVGGVPGDVVGERRFGESNDQLGSVGLIRSGRSASRSEKKKNLGL